MKKIFSGWLLATAQELPDGALVLAASHQMVAELAVLDPGGTTLLGFADIVCYTVAVDEENGAVRIMASEVLRAPAVE
jgi:hypothetical protein